MHAEILAIGSEVTGGQILNANAAFLSRQLARVGIPCLRHTAVPDDPPLIRQALTDAMSRASLVITTGGLGPTLDDVTIPAIAQATGRPLVRVASVERQIRAFCRTHRRPVSRLALRQADLPQGGIALPNPVGTAPGVWLPVEDRLVVALPGVPQEMRAIMERSVLPRLRRLPGRVPITTRTIRTVGLVELEIQAILRRLRVPSEVHIGLYPHLRAVDVRFTVIGRSTAKAMRVLERLERGLRRRLGAAVYGIDDQTLEGMVGQALLRRRLTLAIAESCTGGLVADRITNVPGSSRYLLMGLVAYHNTVKERLLGVSTTMLKRSGAVSAPVARAMAQGVRRCAGADVGLSITGIAGPTGGTRTKPVGLVYVGLADRRRSAVRRFVLHGDRLSIKVQTSQMALDWLRRWLLNDEPPSR